MTLPSSLAVPQSVDHAISRYRFRKALLRAGAWIGLALTVGVLLLIAALLTDRYIDLPASTRLVITLTTMIVPVVLLLVGLSTFFRQSSIESIAGEIDDSVPGARDLLRSSVNLSSRTTGAADPATTQFFMLDQTFTQARSISQAVSPARLLGWGRVPVAFGALIILIPALISLFHSPMMDSALLLNRFLHPTGNFPRPSMIKVLVDFPDSKTIQQGDDITILASLVAGPAGKLPDEPHVGVDLLTNNPSTPQQRVSTVIMTPRPGNQYEATLKNVIEPVTFTVWAADGRSERHTINVTPRPSLTNIVAHYASPSYAQLPATQGPIALREIKALEGTRVRIEFESTIPVAQSKVVFPDRQVPIHWDRERMKGNFQFTIEKETTFNINLTSDTGSDNHNDAPYRVRITPDNPPTVSLLGVPDNLTFYRDDMVNLSYKGNDDFGISDIFIRYHQSGLQQPARDYSLQSVVGAVREASADFSIALRDITTEETDWVEIELVMIDTKGQEGVSPPIRLQIISNTPDRQLAELLTYQEHYAGQVARGAQALKTCAFRLGLLLENMDANDKLTGSRKESFGEINRELASLRFANATDDIYFFRLLPVSEFPYLVQRRTHDLFNRAAAIPDNTVFGSLMDAAAKSDTPKAELQKLKAILDQTLPMAQPIDAGMTALIRETRLQLLDYVATEYMVAERQLQPAPVAKDAKGNAATAPATTLSPEKAGLIREKQEARLKTISGVIDSFERSSDDVLAPIQAIAASIRSAAALPADARVKALSEAIGSLRNRLDNNGELDGRLGVVTETYLRKNPWPSVFQQTRQMQGNSKVAVAVSNWARMGRNSTVFNTPDLFLAVAAQQAAQRAGVSNPTNEANLNKALSTCASLQDWSRQGDLYERVELLRRTLVNMEIETRVGRLNPKNPAYDAAWRQVRELYLSLANDFTAGRFADISPEITQNLTSLSAARGGFASWNWRDTMGSVAWPQTRAAAMATLTTMSDLLAPKVREGRIAALPLAKSLLGDLNQNITDERIRIADELVNIKAEVDAAAANRKANPDAKVTNRKAEPARIAFTKALCERYTGYSTAIAVLSDLRQSAWADHPTAESLPEIKALAVLYEFISNLDEDVYDNTYAIHLQQNLGARGYPQFLTEMSKYMADLSTSAATIDEATQRILAGDSTKLIADNAFMGIPVSINKQLRFNAQIRSLTQQLEFTQSLASASTTPARMNLYRAMISDTKTPTAYWDQLYLACQSLHRLSGTAVRSADGKPIDPNQWIGVNKATLDACAASVEKIRGMLPADFGGVDEFKTIIIPLNDFASVQARVLDSKLAGANSAAKADAYDLFDEDWRGKVQAAMIAMETKVSIPAIKLRPRGRLMVTRTDLDNIMNRLVRSEADWTDRIAVAERTTASTRARLLVSPDSDAVTLDDLAFDFSREGQIRRRSAAALSQSSRNINFEVGGVDEKFLKMPKYLYDELVRNAKKPYPNQFQETGTNYTQGLFKDAR